LQQPRKVGFFNKSDIFHSGKRVGIEIDVKLGGAIIDQKWNSAFLTFSFKSTFSKICTILLAVTTIERRRPLADWALSNSQKVKNVIAEF